MRTRLITAAVALCVLIPVLIFSDTWLFPIAVSVFCLMALFEMFRCVKLSGNLWITLPIYLSAAFLVIGVRLFKNQLGFDTWTFIARVAVPCMLLVTLYLFAVLVFAKGKVAVDSIAIAGFMSLYIVSAFMAILFLRDSASGAYTYLLIFIGAWITDSFAYFTGLLFGKHKLIPEISPKKTVEGSIGGILFCGAAFIIYGIAITYFVESATRMNLGLLFCYGVIVSVVSQIGDLSLSAVKRQYGIKDFGKLFPGHGGVLDRFDSILAVSLVLFVLNEFASIFK